MATATKSKLQQNDPVYISPEELAERWRCSRTTADRVIRREGLSRLYLTEGKNGTVRYVFAEILAYEAKRVIR